MNARFDPGSDSSALAVPFQAKASDDVAEIWSFAIDALDAGMPTALVFLTEIRGGAARALGAQMAVRADGGFCGFVSGGCIESAAAAEALQALEAGNDRQLLLGSGSPYFDIALPCGGGLTLTIHCLKDSAVLERALGAIRARRRVSLRYTPRSASLTLDHDARDTGWDDAGFTMAHRPVPLIFLSGNSIEADALARVAGAAGYEVRRIGSPNPVTPRDFDPDSALVLLHHDLEREVPAMLAGLSGTPFYIGALGGRTTNDRRISRLQGLGYTEEAIAKIKAPIGIFPKARDAVSLALSILADIAASPR